MSVPKIIHTWLLSLQTFWGAAVLVHANSAQTSEVAISIYEQPDAIYREDGDNSRLTDSPQMEVTFVECSQQTLLVKKSTMSLYTVLYHPNTNTRPSVSLRHVYSRDLTEGY